MINQFADDPAGYFGYDCYLAHQVPCGELEALQLAVLRERFADLKDKIPPLGALAKTQNIDAIDTLEDALPLFFPHNIYKSYPERLLIEGDYGLMTKWLSRLTTIDLSSVASQNFATMDDWMDALDSQTELEIRHSSGTSGRLSFYPRGKHEVQQARNLIKMKFTDRLLLPDFKYGDWSYSMIWPAQAFGRTAILRVASVFRGLLTEKEEDFYPYIPTALSSDYHYHVLRCQNLLNQGQEAAPEPSDYVRARLAEADAVYQDIPKLQERLLDTVATLKYKQRIMMFGSPITIHQFSSAGLKRGMENMFMQDSCIITTGGMKNSPAIPTLVEDVQKFTGDVNYLHSYAMTELITGFEKCSHGRYHVHPWIIPYLIDTETGKMLPREGKQVGRACFFDLPVQTNWSGIVTADKVELDWQPCSCTRKTPHLGPEIIRVDEAADELYIGTASRKGIDAALETLTKDIPASN